MGFWLFDIVSTGFWNSGWLFFLLHLFGSSIFVHVFFAVDSAWHIVLQVWRLFAGLFLFNFISRWCPNWFSSFRLFFAFNFLSGIFDKLPIIFWWRWNFYNFVLRSFAGSDMNKIVFIDNIFAALFTYPGSGFTEFDMVLIFQLGNTLLAMFTKNRFTLTEILMSFQLGRWELLFTKLALFFFMVFLLMLLLEIDVIHVSTVRTFLDVSPAIAEMRGHFRLR